MQKGADIDTLVKYLEPSFARKVVRKVKRIIKRFYKNR